MTERIVTPCPRCRAPLAIKRNRETGQEFVGCSTWPRCLHTEPLPEAIILRRQGVKDMFEEDDDDGATHRRAGTDGGDARERDGADAERRAAMTSHARAYILRIAASLESSDGPQAARELTKQLQHDDPTLDAASIARAVAHVRQALDRLPYATIRMEMAA